MTIDWKNAPEGATHWHDAISTWYKIADDSVFYSNYHDVWVFSAYEISDINLSQGFIPRPPSTAIPEPKKLTQAVFDGLPPEYRWAAVDADAAEIEQLRAENERLKVGHDRYEILRKLNVVQFQALYTKALQSHLPFDDLVDILGGSK